MELLRGKVKLPSQETMLNDDFVEKEIIKVKQPMWPVEMQWENEDLLAKEGGFQVSPQYYRIAEDIWFSHIPDDWVTFKQDLLEVNSNNTVKLIKSSKIK